MVRTIDPTRKPQNQSPPPPADSASPATEKKLSVAIIGLGMSGCVAAHFLAKNYNVTCFEIASVPGLYAHSVNDLPGAVSRLDMPLRAVSPHYYQNLYQMYNYLGVELEQTNYQHTVVDLESKEKLFSYLNICCFGLAIPVPYISWNRLTSAALILLGLLQLVFLSPWILFWNRAAIANLSLKEYLTSYGYNADFQHLFFYPMMSTLLSCSYKQVQNYPAVLIAEFMCANATTLFTGWYRVRGAGVYGVASTLLAELDPNQCHFNTRVLSVSTKKTSSGKTKVEVVAEHNFSWASATGSTSSNQPPPSPTAGSKIMSAAAEVNNTRTHTFDHVVVAVEPDVARRIVVTDLAVAEGRCTSEFLNSTKFFTADIIAHRDAGFMMKAGTSVSSSSGSDNEGDCSTTTTTTTSNTSSASASTSSSAGSSPAKSAVNSGVEDVAEQPSNKNCPSPTPAKFSVTKTTTATKTSSFFNKNNKSNGSSSSSSSSSQQQQKRDSSLVEKSYQTLANIVQGVFPYVDTPATGLTVFGTGEDAACSRPVSPPAPRDASTTTANVTLLWKVGQENNQSNCSANSCCNDSSDSSSTKNNNSNQGNNNNNNSSCNSCCKKPDPNLLFETWNPVGLPKNIVKRARMTRAVWDVEGFVFAESFAKHAQGYGNIWFAGSYCSRGVTLLEQACTSALDVAIDFGCAMPFEVKNPSQNPLNASWWMIVISFYFTVLDFFVRMFFKIEGFAFGLVFAKGKKNVVENDSKKKTNEEGNSVEVENDKTK